MQIKCLGQDLRVPDLRLHQLSTNGDFLKESTADQTRLIDERNPGNTRFTRRVLGITRKNDAQITGYHPSNYVL